MKDYTLLKFISNCISYWTWKAWQFKGILSLLGVAIVIIAYLILKFKGLI